MNTAVRRFFAGTPILRRVYTTARSAYHRRRLVNKARTFIVNVDAYRDALRREDGRIVDLTTNDGLVITIRRNYMDASILGEVFLDNCYVRGLSLPERPVIVDIGGYIGDFSLYAAKRLNALKVVVCEPSPQNWALLTKNVAANHYEDRIVTVNKAVTDGRPVMMNVNAPSRGQARVSAYGKGNVECQLIPGVTLKNLVDAHGLDVIHLLKIDCEGGEYDILLTSPSDVYSRVHNVVFEYHEIDGFAAKLEAVKQRLRDEGFYFEVHGSLVSASRTDK